MADPFRQFDSLLKAAQDAQRFLAPAQHLADQIAKSSAFLTSHRSGVADALVEMQRRRELFEPGLGIQRIIAQMKASQELADRLTADYRSSLVSISDQANRWRSIVEPAVRQMNELQSISRSVAGIADSFVAWESTAARLAQRFGEIGLLNHKAALAERLLAPNLVFTDFVKATITRLEHVTNPRQSWALETSLRLAEEQLIATADSLDSFVVVPDDEEEASAFQVLRSPYIQQEELLDAVSDARNIDDVDLLQVSPAANAVDLSRSVLTTIAICNEARKVAGAEEIFKPTTRLLEVYVDLPWLMANDKNSFASFVDCLYFLFYEGAGKDNLRFLKANGGPIADDDFEFILCIKHLRNKWTRHDADHGKDTAIRKSWAELSAQLLWLGLDHIPVTAEDFRLLHMNLLMKATDFANKILRGISGQ